MEISSEPKENEEENAKRRKVEVLRLGLLSSTLTLQRKRVQYDNLQKKVSWYKFLWDIAKKCKRCPTQVFWKVKFKCQLYPSCPSRPSCIDLSDGQIFLVMRLQWSFFQSDAISVFFGHTIPFLLMPLFGFHHRWLCFSMFCFCTIFGWFSWFPKVFLRFGIDVFEVHWLSFAIISDDRQPSV